MDSVCLIVRAVVQQIAALNGDALAFRVLFLHAFQKAAIYTEVAKLL